MDGRQAWEQAQAALASGDIADARRHLQATLLHHRDHTYAWVLLAGTSLAEGRLRDACAQLLEAKRSLPPDPGLACRVAQGLVRVGETIAARDVMGHPAIAACRDGPTLAALAHVHQLLGQHPDSLALLERARAAGFDSADFRYFLSIQLQFNGRLEDAERELEACLDAGPTYGRASLTLARLRRQTPERNHLASIERRLREVPNDSEDHAAFEFARYKELEDLGRFDEAWDALARGNEIMRRRTRYDADREARLLASVIDVCDRRFVGQSAGEDAHGGPRPLFIVGLPRSGTTVLDRILDNHSAIRSGGELADFGHQLRWAADVPGRTLLDETVVARLRRLDFREIGRRVLERIAWRADGRAWLVDKLPAHFMVVGLIAKALPQARFVHVTRAPLDVCFSNYRALFGDAYPYSYNLDSLAVHHRHYRRVMAHWREVVPDRVHEVSYEALVTAPRATARALTTFMGLPYEADATDLVRNVRPVATLSAPQVREGLHTRSLEAWRPYEGQLAPLAAQLSAPI